MNEIKTIRLSNIELLRIVAMFLVLALHANYYTHGAVTLEELGASKVSAIFRTYFQGITICCVNIFVLISGWFGICVSKRSFASFVFQCLYFLIGVYLISVFVGNTTFSLKGFLENFLIVQDLDYWFIKSYIGLYLLSPVLNVFSEHVDKRQFQVVLISFFVYQTVYGWIYPSVATINGGYSIISFIGLYLLARYVRKHSMKCFQYSRHTDLYIILGLSLLQLFFSVCAILSGKPIVGKFIDFGGYINPVTILMSLYIVILFSKLRITSSVINNIAKSSFAVYLFHTHKCIFKPLFCSPVFEASENYNGISGLAIIGIFIILVFFVSILLDIPRRILWKYIESRVVGKNINGYENYFKSKE